MSSKTTIDPDVIREWAEARGGKPARVRNTGHGSDPGIVRIDFPGYSGEETLEEITWEEFFEKFEDSQLALILQETTDSGEKSRFNKLVSRDSVGG